MVDSQRRLYDLGLFNEVDMAVQNPDGQEPSKDVLFNLQEAKRWTFRYGGGIEFATGNIPTTNNPQGNTGVSPNGVLEITRLNMFGRDQTLTMRARVGLLTRRGLIGYDAPRLFHRENWRIQRHRFLRQHGRREYLHLGTPGRHASRPSRSTAAATTLLYRISYQRVAVDPNSLVIDPTLIPLVFEAGSHSPCRVSPTCATRATIRLTRTKGSYNIVDLGLATSALGSEANFGKVLLQNSTYYTFKKQWVLRAKHADWDRASLRHQQFPQPATSGTPLPTEATSVPLPELFFSGGSNSLRGFSINQAGPRDLATGYPIGGQGLFVNNLEIRTPPVALPYVGDNLGFVFFHDMGNVFDTANHIISGMLRIHQPSIANCSPPSSTKPATSATTRRPSGWACAIRHRWARFASTLATTSTRHAIPSRNRTRRRRCATSISFSVLDKHSDETNFSICRLACLLLVLAAVRPAHWAAR